MATNLDFANDPTLFSTNKNVTNLKTITLHQCLLFLRPYRKLEACAFGTGKHIKQ